MGLLDYFGDDSAFQEVYNGDLRILEQQGKLTPEFIGRAAAFAAARTYEEHLQDGQPPSHAVAKARIACRADDEVTVLLATRGLDFVDPEETQNHARKEALQALNQSGLY